MESKSTFVILIAAVAILAIALAVMTGYIFFVQSSDPRNDVSDSNGESSLQQVYKDDELATKALFENNKYFNLKNVEGSKTVSIIQTGINIIYPKQVKGVKSIEEKFKLYEPKMKQLVIKYFLGVTIDDIQKPDAIETASEILAQQMNELLNKGENEKEPKTFIVEVVFDEWVFQ